MAEEVDKNVETEDGQLESGGKEEETTEQPVEGDEGDSQETGEEDQETEGEGGEQGDEPERPVSRRESLRIQQLLAKLKDKDETPRTESKSKGIDYKTALDADEDTVNQLESDRTQYGESRYAEGLEEARSIQFHTRLEIDAPRVEAKYPVLDKESDRFNPVVANALNQMYLSAVGFNPNTGRVQNSDIRYKDYIDSIMELSEEVASEKVATSSKNIARQAASTGLRPGGNSTKSLNLNQAPDKMSIEELNAAIKRGFGQ